jgi:hypothetical protein
MHTTLPPRPLLRNKLRYKYTSHTAHNTETLVRNSLEAIS